MSVLRALRLCLAAALLVSAAGCSGAQTDVNSPEFIQRQIAAADVRLRGTWTLASFQPETPLEPMLQTMLEYQFNRVMVRFDGKRIVADSPGIHIERTYQITEPNGDEFKLTAFDAQGVPYESVCTFRDNTHIELHSHTMPWRGYGTLVRVGM
jgi:hypothetical protein